MPRSFRRWSQSGPICATEPSVENIRTRTYAGNRIRLTVLCGFQLNNWPVHSSHQYPSSKSTQRAIIQYLIEDWGPLGWYALSCRREGIFTSFVVLSWSRFLWRQTFQIFITSWRFVQIFLFWPTLNFGKYGKSKRTLKSHLPPQPLDLESFGENTIHTFTYEELSCRPKNQKKAFAGRFSKNRGTKRDPSGCRRSFFGRQIDSTHQIT